MALLLGPDQELVQKVVREFAQSVLAPEATRIDREQRFPRDHLPKLAELGLLGMLVPPEDGGAGTDTLSYVVALEEVAKASGTHAALLVLANTVVAHLLHKVGDPHQKASGLKAVLAGQAVGAFALTEEAGGSSQADFLTTAVPSGDGFVINGAKSFIGAGTQADLLILLATIPNQGPTFFLLDPKLQGLHFTKPESTLGLRGLPLPDLYINQLHVDSKARLGPAGRALEVVTESLHLARLGVAAALVGLAQAALDQSVAFAKQRVQFGQAIVNFGAVRGMLADVQADLEAARATTYGAAALRDSKRDFVEEVYEARLLAHRIAVRGTRIAHKVHGGAGFMRDLPLERVSRDVRTLMHLWDAHDVVRSRLADHFLQ